MSTEKISVFTFEAAVTVQARICAEDWPEALALLHTLDFKAEDRNWLNVLFMRQFRLEAVQALNDKKAAVRTAGGDIIPINFKKKGKIT